MSFNGFTIEDFKTFTIDGLDARMKAIQERIQPKFRALGEELSADVSVLAGREMFVHIAKHARRKVNPPVDTWMAFCANKRGYKQYPHFQIGLFDDRLFIWLAFIYELPDKRSIADTFLRHLPQFRQQIPAEYSLSFDHMKKDAVTAGDLNKQQFIGALERFRDVKSAELLIGRQIPSDSPVVGDGEAFIRLAKNTLETLMPLYKMAVEQD
jgi:uncharacterized protein YktB (UPF0637 family)